MLKVKIQPGAGRDEVVGKLGDCVKIKISAPAIDGKANEALVQFLSKVLNVPKGKITIKSGLKSRTKLVDLPFTSSSEAEDRLLGKT
jgi:uncharacterized protein (TIGR00251 family)